MNQCSVTLQNLEERTEIVGADILTRQKFICLTNTHFCTISSRNLKLAIKSRHYKSKEVAAAKLGILATITSFVTELLFVLLMIMRKAKVLKSLTKYFQNELNVFFWQFLFCTNFPIFNFKPR